MESMTLGMATEKIKDDDSAQRDIQLKQESSKLQPVACFHTSRKDDAVASESSRSGVSLANEMRVAVAVQHNAKPEEEELGMFERVACFHTSRKDHAVASENSRSGDSFAKEVREADAFQHDAKPEEIEDEREPSTLELALPIDKILNGANVAVEALRWGTSVAKAKAVEIRDSRMIQQALPMNKIRNGANVAAETMKWGAFVAKEKVIEIRDSRAIQQALPTDELSNKVNVAMETVKWGASVVKQKFLEIDEDQDSEILDTLPEMIREEEASG